MKLTEFSALTFDCYGTLIDWETGILSAVEPILQKAGRDVPRADLLDAFGRNEAAQQAETPSALYPEILRDVVKRMATELKFEISDDDAIRFGNSVADWPAFPDSAEALQYLKQHYKLVILSNVDRASFAHSNEKLGVDFDHLFTAQDIGSYKPDPQNFAYMIEKLAEEGIGKTDILHTAQSLRHDHVPANDAGLATCWIDRQHATGGQGAAAQPPRMPRIDFRFPSLGDMAEAHQRISH